MHASWGVDSRKALENARDHASLGLVWLVCVPKAALAVVRSHYQKGCTSVLNLHQISHLFSGSMRPCGTFSRQKYLGNTG